MKIKYADQLLNQAVTVTGASGSQLVQQVAMAVPDLAVGDAVLIKRVTLTVDPSGDVLDYDTGA